MTYVVTLKCVPKVDMIVVKCSLEQVFQGKAVQLLLMCSKSQCERISQMCTVRLAGSNRVVLWIERRVTRTFICLVGRGADPIYIPDLGRRWRPQGCYR